MGNTHSDQDAYNIIKLIPVLNLAYSLPRAVVYAAKGDEKQAVHTAVSIPGNIIAAGVCFVAGPAAGAAVNTATNVFAAAAGTGYDVAARIQAQNNPGLAKDALDQLASEPVVNTEVKELRSQDGRFKFVMQDDGNVVLYKGAHPTWASKTCRGGGPFKLLMQGDGNLVAYYPNNMHPFWASNTYVPGTGPFSLVMMQNDGNCVIYNGSSHPIWATNTWES